jgi:hypothetical protein
MSENIGSAPAGNPPVGGEVIPPNGVPPSGNAPAIAWLPDADADAAGYIQNKKWGGPGEMLKSYRNLETVIGAPHDQILRLPKEGDDAAWAGVYDRLGRPKTAEEYEVPVPEVGSDPDYVKGFKEKAHELGLNPRQVKALAEWNNSQVTGMQSKMGEDYQTSLATEQGNLRKEWGAAHDQNTAIAKHAAGKFGVAAEHVEALEKTMGYAATIKFFHNIGAKMGEGAFVSGDRGNAGASFGGVLTPGQAQQRINELRGDKDWTASYLSGGQRGADAQSAGASQCSRLRTNAQPANGWYWP